MHNHGTLQRLIKSRNQTKKLRTLLIDVDTKDEKIKLYIGINKDTRGDGVFFPFPTALETEAHDMITHFRIFLAYETSPDVLLYLKQEAAKRSKAAT